MYSWVLNSSIIPPQNKGTKKKKYLLYSFVSLCLCGKNFISALQTPLSLGSDDSEISPLNQRRYTRRLWGKASLLLYLKIRIVVGKHRQSCCILNPGFYRPKC